MKKPILIMLLIVMAISLFAYNSAEKKFDSAVADEVENTKTTAENFIRDGYTEQVKLTTQPMKDTTGQGRIAFMIEAEGETDRIHNLFIVVVDGQQAELIAKIF